MIGLMSAATLALSLWAAPEPDVLRFEVLYTSDVHGHIDRGRATFLNPEFPPPLGGSASVLAYLEEVRDEARRAERRVLLFDSGDMFQGTPIGTRTEGTAVIEWMNRAGYDAATLGNHDFDLGRDNAERLARLARFPILAANLYDRSSGARVAWARDRVDFDLDGARLAVIGYITESTVNMAFAKNIEGLEFRPIIECMPDDVRRARAAGADLVFVLLHHGMPYRTDLETAYFRMVERDSVEGPRHFGMDAMELAHAVEGVDAIFAGHTHQGFDRPWEDPLTHTLVFEPYANGSSLGHVTFKIHRPTRSLIGYETHFDRGALLTLLEDEVWPDTVEAARIAQQVAEAERGLEVEVGRTTVRLARGGAGESLMGFVLADAFRVELGADFAIQNTGGVRADLEPGSITERDLLQVSPFENQMVLARLDGALLRSLLEDKLRGSGGGILISGGAVRFDPARSDGERIVSFTIGGAPVDSARVYSVAMTNYLAEGNSGLWRLRDLPPETFMPSGFTDVEVLGRYIRRLGVLSPVNDGRWSESKGF